MEKQRIVIIGIGLGSLIVLSIAVGVFIGLRDIRTAATSSIYKTYDPSQTSILPSRNYVEARARMVQDEQSHLMKERLKNSKMDTSGVQNIQRSLGKQDSCVELSEQACLNNAKCFASYRRLESPPSSDIIGEWSGANQFHSCDTIDKNPLRCKRVVNTWESSFCL